MSNKPVFVATHPRACSTAFERVFMTCRENLKCIHEPFGDAFYYGPERLGSRFENDEDGREKSGFKDSTFKTIMDRIDSDGAEGKRIFIKDITHYLVPPQKQEARIAPSLRIPKRGVGTDEQSAESEGADKEANGSDSGVDLDSPPKSPPFPYDTAAEPSNPTVMPRELLEKFHFTFLIRHPRNAIPSYYRCCVPPLVEKTGFHEFMPEEAGYDELRRTFDYCKDTGIVGPKICGRDTGAVAPPGSVEICVIDADDLLDDPEGILRQYCASIGVEFTQSMLNWNDEDQKDAQEAFEKWNGFHEDAIHSTDLKPRKHKKKIPKSEEQLYFEWKETYGEKAADVIKRTVAENVPDYEYLKQFAIKPVNLPAN